MKKQNDIKIIYNPFAGAKRRLAVGGSVSLDDVKCLMKKYQIEADYFTVSDKRRALDLSKESLKESYTTIVAAGGDGTVNEVANGLVNSEKKLGILPLGTFMNIGKMLSIKNDIESAIMLIKIGRTRKIDLGSVTKINGEKLEEPYYFIETAGIGLDAELQELFKNVEDGHYADIFKILSTFLKFYNVPINMDFDGESRTVRSTLIEISNGPYTGAALKIAPGAKLNDHKLTIALYRMSKPELIKYFINMKRGIIKREKKIEKFQVEEVRVNSNFSRLVHADASLFGVTPVSFKIVPNALEVICGFPDPDEEQSLEARSVLDPS